MNRGIQQAVQRFQKSAFTAGAMSRLFVVVGAPSLKATFFSELEEADFELIPGKMNAMGIFPAEFLQHQGTHFNRKLFVLEGYDELASMLGNELFARLEFERRQLTRTATWSLIWIESLERAEELRRRLPGFWSLSHETMVFLETKEIQSANLFPWSGTLSIFSSFSPLLIPPSFEKATPNEIHLTAIPNETRFWGDLLRCSAHDLLLTAGFMLREKQGISSELVYVLGNIAEEWGQDEFASFCRARVGSVPKNEEKISPHHWIHEGERILRSLGEDLTDLNAYIAKAFHDQLYLLADRPLRARAMVHRGFGKISEAAADLNEWEKIAEKSGIPTLIASSLEAKANHLEELGDASQSQTFRTQAAQIRNKK